MISKSAQENPILGELAKKREKYKEFALSSKKEGDKSGAVWGLTAVKQCDEMTRLIYKNLLFKIRLNTSYATELC